MDKDNNIKEHWNDIAKNRTNSKDATHPDLNLRDIEINNIVEFMRDGLRILDVGCGNGYSTIEIAKKFNVDIVGVDYSSIMIDSAHKSLRESGKIKGKVTFKEMDVMNLDFEDNRFDIVLTERCLINIIGWDNKEKALREIYRVIKKSGKYLMIEANKGGLDKLNSLRKIFDLEPIKTVWHNENFDEDLLNRFIKTRYKLIERRNFGFYYIVTRVIHPALVAPESPKYEAKINVIAKELNLMLPDLYEHSPHMFLLLEKI